MRNEIANLQFGNNLLALQSKCKDKTKKNWLGFAVKVFGALA